MKEKDFRRLSAQKVVDFYNASPFAVRNNLVATEGDFLYLGSDQNNRTAVSFFQPVTDDRMLYMVEMDRKSGVATVRRYEMRSLSVGKRY